MEQLGVRNFDLCIVAIGDDFQSSLETTALLKDLGARYVVARAARDVHAKFLLRNGADEVVYPEKQLANWTAIRYSSDHIFDYIELNRDNAIVEVSVPPDWYGKSRGRAGRAQKVRHQPAGGQGRRQAEHRRQLQHALYRARNGAGAGHEPRDSEVLPHLTRVDSRAASGI